MAQGGLKVKNQKNGVLRTQMLKKKKDVKKISSIKRKGGRYITPKQMKAKEAEKLRKGLENVIKNSIEDELKVKASKEGKPFHVVTAAAGKSNIKVTKANRNKMLRKK